MEKSLIRTREYADTSFMWIDSGYLSLILSRFVLYVYFRPVLPVWIDHTIKYSQKLKNELFFLIFKT